MCRDGRLSRAHVLIAGPPVSPRLALAPALRSVRASAARPCHHSAVPRLRSLGHASSRVECASRRPPQRALQERPNPSAHPILSIPGLSPVRSWPSKGVRGEGPGRWGRAHFCVFRLLVSARFEQRRNALQIPVIGRNVKRSPFVLNRGGGIHRGASAQTEGTRRPRTARR